MARKDEPYKNLKMQGEQGDYSALIPPLDYVILGHLPGPDEMSFGLYPRGETAKQLAATHLKPMKLSEVSSRLRILHALQLVQKVKMFSRTSDGFQQTERGKKVHDEWEKSQKEAKK